jgi:iron uptake system component EfeO
VALTTGALLAVPLAGCASGTPGTRAGTISITTGACGNRWQLPQAGWHTFQLKNASAAAAEVYLVNPANDAIYAAADGMGPGTTRAMRVDVGSGTYAFRCLLEDTDPITGPSVWVSGHVRGAPGILPVTVNDLIGPARQYHAYVTAGLVVLARQTAALTIDILAGRLAAARRSWRPAHLTYERLGAAYGTFGDFDSEIDTRADGLRQGVHDPGFTGFYRLEYGLWHGQSRAQLAAPARALRQAVRKLQAAFPHLEVDLLDLGLRTHEILENALQFQLTGHDDYGSGTTLATTAANITGTRELLSILHPLLAARYRGLPAAQAALDRLQQRLSAQHHASGQWTPVRQLAALAREQLDAAAGQALQDLAPIAVITEPRRV